MLNRKKKEFIIQKQEELLLEIINIIAKAPGKSAAEKNYLTSYLMFLKEVVDLEKERLDFEKYLSKAGQDE